MPKKNHLRVHWSRRAVRDLDGITAYIARDNPTAARARVRKLRKVVEDTSHMPMSARMVPELQREDVREALLKGYRVVFQVTDESLVVLTVAGGGRQLGL